MKGIILAGGTGTRLYPSTRVLSKQMIPVYDKPMVYYSLTTLMLAGIQDILIISTPHDLPMYQELLGDGQQWGIHISYAPQAKPAGIAQAFIIGEEFIGNDAVALILGDNLIYGQGFGESLQKTVDQFDHGATIFGYYVKDPRRYGVFAFDEDKNIIDIIEKPQNPPSNYASIGLYFYDNQVVEIAKSLKASPRGELEITDVSRAYLEMKQLSVKKVGRGVAWLDTGTHDSLLAAANFIQVLEQRQGLKIGCPEEVAWRKGYISDDQFKQLANSLLSSGYGQYLLSLFEF